MPPGQGFLLSMARVQSARHNRTNLDAGDFGQALLSVLPIRLADADGAPVRAVAVQLEWSV